MKLTDYESDATRFIKAFLQDNPLVVEKQKQHRATWWDRPQSVEERRKAAEATVPSTGYAYYSNP